MNRLNRFIGTFDFSRTPLEVTEKKLLHQWHDVLRFKKGDVVILCDGGNREVEGLIKNINKSSCVLLLREVKNVLVEYSVRCVLYCALLKKENFEFVVQKCTEIGIAEIVPIVTQRTVKLAISSERLKRIAQEAAEQSGRGIVPVIETQLSFSESIAMAAKNEWNGLFDPSGSPFDVQLNIMIQKTFFRGIFIGPEGGWSEEEKDKTREYGMSIVNLGRTILRAETAALVASYRVQTLY